MSLPLYVQKSLLAAVCLVPGFILPKIMERCCGVKPEVTLFWFIIGILFGITFWFRFSTTLEAQNFVPSHAVLNAILLLSVVLTGFVIVSAPTVVTAVLILALIIVGALAGTAANVLAFQATIIAPNPGIATSILGVANILIFFTMIGLAILAPKLFGEAQFQWHYLLGIVLMTAGVFLLSVKKIDIGIFAK